MKIKLDFVTNSSSTSFCGFGVAIDTTELKKMIKLDWVSTVIPPTPEEFFEELDTILGKNGLTRMTNPADVHFIGATFSDAHEDETQREMKTRCEKAFKELGIREKVCFMEESWYDG